MKTLTVKLTNNTYPVYLGEDLLKTPDLLQQHVCSKQVLIVSQQIIANHYLQKIQQALPEKQCHHIILSPSEQAKTIDEWQSILNYLIEHKFHRDATLIALGGGVVSDVTGFAAACYLRGIAFITIPTTLLAQVDASIGGKTAINHPQGKNLIGAFYQPRAVFIDSHTLTTLPEREYCSGLAEVIKAALLADEAFFIWLEKNIYAIMQRESDYLITMIEKACQIKRDIVTHDEKESGIRALLNLGHTFAHAIEKVIGYGKVLHGEAVAIGLVLAVRLSRQCGHLDDAVAERVTILIQQASLPTSLPKAIAIPPLLAAMQYDKKIVNQQLRFILLKKIGQAYIDSTIKPAQLLNLFN